MSFLNPWLLLGALGVAVPVVIHLLNRYRYRLVDWGAMELLRRALVVRSRRVRLEDMLLLALRCLALLLLAVALARPVLTPESSAWAGGQADVGAVIALDASYSMQHRPGVQSRFERAVGRAREVAKTLKPGHTVSLVLLGDRPRVLLRNVGYDDDRFDQALTSTPALPERLNLEAGLDEIKTLLGEMKTPVREVYLITDAQAATWGRLSEQARRNLGQVGSAGRLYCLPVAAEQAENVAVTRFERTSGGVHKGGTARYEVEVRNTGARPRESVPVTLYVNEAPVDQRTLDRLEPGQAVTVPLFARFDRTGIARLSVRLGPDELTTDNARHAVAAVRERTRILCVRAAAPLPGAKDFLLTALTAAPGEALTVDAVSWLDLPARRLADYQLVILANVPDLPDEQARTLFHYVRQGGGLIIVLGESVRSVVFNARMRQDGVPLLPGELVEAVEDAANGWSIELPGHPLTRVLETLPPDLVKDARVHRYFRLKLHEGGRSALALTGTGDPLLAERPLGRGRVVLFATAADPAWTNMVVEPGFYPMLLHEAVAFLGREAYERPTVVSERLSLPLPAGADPSSPAGVTFRDPQGRPLALPPVVRDGLTYAELAHAELPGFYELAYAPQAPPLIAAVNVDPREADVRSLPDSELANALQGLNVRIIGEADRLAAVVQESRVGVELWAAFLLLALVVLFVEAFLAHRFTRRAGPHPPALFPAREGRADQRKGGTTLHGRQPQEAPQRPG